MTQLSLANRNNFTRSNCNRKHRSSLIISQQPSLTMSLLALVSSIALSALHSWRWFVVISRQISPTSSRYHHPCSIQLHLMELKRSCITDLFSILRVFDSESCAVRGTVPDHRLWKAIGKQFRFVGWVLRGNVVLFLHPPKAGVFHLVRRSSFSKSLKKIQHPNVNQSSIFYF